MLSMEILNMSGECRSLPLRQTPMFLVKIIAIGSALYAAYAWYQGRSSRISIALTIAGAAFAFWVSREIIQWIETLQS